MPSRARRTCAQREGGQRAAHRSTRLHARARSTGGESRRDAHGPERAAGGRPPAPGPHDTPAVPSCAPDAPARGSSQLNVASSKCLDDLAGTREGRRGEARWGGGEEDAPALPPLQSPLALLPRSLYLLGPRKKPCTSPEVAAEVERGRSTRLADEAAPRWFWAVVEGGRARGQVATKAYERSGEACRASPARSVEREERDEARGERITNRHKAGA